MSRLLKYIGIFLFLNILLYFAASFIALSFNPLCWDMITNVDGRVCLVLFECVVIAYLIVFYTGKL